MNRQDYLKIVLGFLVVTILFYVGTTLVKQENFNTCPYKNVHPDVISKEYLNSSEESNNESSNDFNDANTSSNNRNSEVQSDKLDKILTKLEEHEVDDENYVKRQNIVRAAQSAANEFCPVSPDFDLSQYVKKTEIDNLSKCPKVPDMKDFVLKSSIPPASKCPSCICPKVKVSSGFCKKCPEPKDICPAPAPCGPEQCKNVVDCPKCPAPPKQKPLRCPPPKACPTPPPCPAPTRCPPNQCPKCKYYGIKKVESSKSIEEMINDLMSGDSEDKLAKLNALRDLLGVRLAEEKIKCENKKKSKGKPTPSNVDNDANMPTTMASEPEDKSYLKPVVDYDNKCVDNTLFYSAEGMLGSDFN